MNYYFIFDGKFQFSFGDSTFRERGRDGSVLFQKRVPFFASASSFEGNEVRKSFRFGLKEKKVPINLDFEFPKEFKWGDECIVNFLQPAKL